MPTAPAASASAAETGPPPVLTGDALTDVNSKAGLFFNEQTAEPAPVDRGRFRVAGGPVGAGGQGPFPPLGCLRAPCHRTNSNCTSCRRTGSSWKSMEGKTTRYRRGQAYTPTEADLKAFAGRYGSDELKAVIQMAPGKGGLMGRINDSRGDGFEFKPVDRDTFQLRHAHDPLPPGPDRRRSWGSTLPIRCSARSSSSG